MLLGADPAELTALGVLGPGDSTHGLSAWGDFHTVKLTDLSALLSRLQGLHQQMHKNQMSSTVLICCSCCTVGATLSWETEALGDGQSLPSEMMLVVVCCPWLGCGTGEGPPRCVPVPSSPLNK